MHALEGRQRPAGEAKRRGREGRGRVCARSPPGRGEIDDHQLVGLLALSESCIEIPFTVHAANLPTRVMPAAPAAPASAAATAVQRGRAATAIARQRLRQAPGATQQERH